MSVYWVYLSDPSPQMVQPLAQSLVNQPIANSKVVYHALTSRTIDNKLTLMDSKLAWSYLPGFQSSKPDTSKHFHIFVGDLCPKLHPQQLYESFTSFGQISECKIIQDPQTLNSRGYGFVTFVKKDDAENAITSMNGKWIGSRAIRTNWAVRKKSLTSQTEGGSGKGLNYDDVFIQTPASNCTVYCGGVMTGLTEEQMIQTFSEFGNILEIRLFKDKGYAFVRFDSKESATRAIVEKHLSEVNGHIVKCSWGKKNEDGRCSPSPPSLTQLFTPTLMPTTGYLIQPPPAQPNFANLTFGSSDINNQLRYFLLPENSPKVHDGPVLHQQGYSLPIQFPTVVPTVQHPTMTLQQQQQQQQQQLGSYIYSLGL